MSAIRTLAFVAECVNTAIDAAQATVDCAHEPWARSYLHVSAEKLDVACGAMRGEFASAGLAALVKVQK